MSLKVKYKSLETHTPLAPKVLIVISVSPNWQVCGVADCCKNLSGSSLKCLLIKRMALGAFQNMKQARVQLMKRMKEESERHRRQQTECNREVRALRMRQQQQSAQMARMERQNAMRINVLQRRMEEALAAKNKLEAAQCRRLENRANASGFDSMALRVKARVPGG